MNLKIKETAKLTGVTVRTLHYYDKIGLLKPGIITESGYRMYNEKNLETLQQILFFRELDFPLKDIKEILDNPAFDKLHALQNHKELLIKKRKQLNNLIALIDEILKSLGVMYTKDQRFKEYLDKFGNGTADYISKAIEAC